MEKKEYIIVGAGSAGCVLANRLSENLQTQVLLLEAGKPDQKKEIHIPIAFSRLFKSESDWSYYTEPQKQLNNRQLFYPRGKTLGGSSSINAMIYIRGHRHDYDHWSELGNLGWSFAEVLPYFQKAENYQQPPAKNYGEEGYLSISDRPYTNILSRKFLAACEKSGIPLINDLNSPEPEGVGLYKVTQKNGQRHSSAKAYLKPILDRQNLTILTEAQVTRLICPEKQVMGVEYFHQGKRHQVNCNQEVILCGGAINSPQLLMLSGIGPGFHLQELGIPVVIDLPGVGQNLQDHLVTGVYYQSHPQITLDRSENIINLLQYMFGKKGAFTSNVGEAGGFVKTQPDLPQPDLQLYFAPCYFIKHGWIKPEGGGFTIGASAIHPQSLGYLKLSSRDPLAPPQIQPNYLSHESDLSVLIKGIKLGRQIGENSALAQFRGSEYLPGKEVQTDEAIADYIREYTETIYHPVGTCKMGNDQMSVVNSQLQVHGIQGLRVVDASIMPTIISGNTNAATMMIAEKAADLIRAGGNTTRDS